MEKKKTNEQTYILCKSNLDSGLHDLGLNHGFADEIAREKLSFHVLL